MTILILTVIVVILDQVTKYILRSSMSLYESRTIIENFFNLTYVTNDGMAFGINFPGGFYIFTGVSIIMTIIIFWYLWKERLSSLMLRTSLAFILAGAIGNLIDRILYGEVADFLDFSFWGYHWYIFNIADSSVTIGMILFIIYSIIINTSEKSVKSIV
jgi:signal peptidase II